MEPTPDKNLVRPERSTEKESSAEHQTPAGEDPLSRERLPLPPEDDRRELEPDDGGDPPPDTTVASPEIDAMLGRFHVSAAIGIGSSITYIGVALGAGETFAGIAGLATYCIAHGRFMARIAEDCSHQVLTPTGSVALPPEYLRGTMSVFTPAIIVGLLGYTQPETFAKPALMALFAATVFFGALHRQDTESGPDSAP